jgi:hypothetical protein
MYVAATILSILLAFVALLGQDLSLGVHARGVVRRRPKLVLKGTSAQLQSHRGLSPGLRRFIGAAEVLATVGLSSACSGGRWVSPRWSASPLCSSEPSVSTPAPVTMSPR